MSLSGLAGVVVLAQVLRGLIAAGDQEAVRFDRGAGGTTLSLLTTVATPPERLIALLADPATYRRAVPAFVRAETLAEQPGKAGSPGSPATRDRLLAWELEVPLWNLEGRLWLRPHPAGADLELVQGDLAPGKLELRVEPDPAGSLLRLSGGANLKDANFMTRRLAARDREAEPAMTVTAMYVLLRALALEAVRSGPPLPRRQPTVAMAAGPLGAEAPGFFARLPEVTPGSLHARITSRPSGRLDRVEIAVPLPLPAATAAARLLEPGRWQALPGWKHIANLGGRPVRWEVDASLPFVDFDATWTLHSERPFRAEADGDWQGAAIAVDLFSSGAGAVMVFTTHPRVDATGYIPRKLIEAEPLLEHGLALGLAFVDAGALTRSIMVERVERAHRPAPPPAPQLSPSGRQKIE